MDTFQKNQASTIWYSFFASVILFSFILLWKRRTSTKTNTIPEPVGAWPLLGHLHMLLGPELPHIKLGTMADKYGPIFSMRLGLHTSLVVSDSEVAKECLATNDRVFATRPSLTAAKIMGYAMFSLEPYGPFWREVRKIAILELLSNRRIELLRQVRDSEVNTSLKELYQLCAGGTVLVDMQQWFGDLTLNVSVRMIAGKRYFGPKLDNYESKRLQKAIKEFLRLFGLFTVSDALPFLRWLDIQGHQKAMKRTAKDIDGILGRWLEEHKQKHVVGGEKVEGNMDFMDVMLSVLRDEKLFGYEADAVNKATCMNMILGGNDTTMVTLTWALSLLVNNRHTMNKAQDEIEIHVGKARNVEESDIEKLVYLQAIVKETLRMYPAAPLGAPREAMEDCTIAGYHVPKGTRLIVNLSKIQRDPRVWPNPDEFQPERFLTSHENIDVRGQHFELIPFSAGRRSCPGISFALHVVHLTLARLLQAFDFETLSGAAMDMTGSAGLTHNKAIPLQVLVTPRLPHHLY